MTSDWDLENETQKIRESDIYADAIIAAKLVLCGYDRDAAVYKVNEVNELREEYRNDPGVYIPGDEDQPSEWTLSECNFPVEIKNIETNHQVRAIANEMRQYFE
ncbi:MAG: hypothetical protein AB1423_10930 [Pseudomonadota bacterium]